MNERDWRDLAKVLTSGEMKTWGVQDASTHHLGIVLRAMAQRCTEIADDRQAEAGNSL